MTETELQLADANDTRRTIIREVIASDMTARDAAASLGISIAWLYALRRRYLAHGEAGLVGAGHCGRSKRAPAAVKAGTLRRWLVQEDLIRVRQRTSNSSAPSFAFRTSARRRYEAVRLRQELAAFRVPQQSGMTQALIKAFEALAVCAEEVMDRAKHELTANDFLDLMDRMAAARQTTGELVGLAGRGKDLHSRTSRLI